MNAGECFDTALRRSTNIRARSAYTIEYIIVIKLTFMLVSINMSSINRRVSNERKKKVSVKEVTEERKFLRFTFSR